jgi:hypothetical protein
MTGLGFEYLKTAIADEFAAREEDNPNLIPRTRSSPIPVVGGAESAGAIQL